MAVKHITEVEFEELVRSEKKLFVDFYADWCGPCKMMEPIIDQVSNEVSDVTFAAVNVDDAERLALKFGISSIPCMIFFKEGEEADRVLGRVPKQTIVDTVNG